MRTNTKKVLFSATVMEHFRAFHLPYMSYFMSRGYEVHALAGTDCELPKGIIKHIVPIKRSPFDTDNIKAYKQIRSLLGAVDFDLIHCHTPVGGVLTRLAAKRARKRGTKLIYTAHGFHFYKGAPLSGWLLYYPLEKWLGKYTDVLITINEEDFARAKQKRLCADVRHIHGIGADAEKFRPLTEEGRIQRRRELGFEQDAFLCACVGELNDNKNQELILKAMPSLLERRPEFRLLLAGQGANEQKLKQSIKSLGLENRAIMLGYRNDLDRLLPCCDALVSASLREGLPVNVLEAMLCGLPLALSNNRGHRELVTDGREGFRFDPRSSAQLADCLNRLMDSPETAREMGTKAREKVQPYALQNTLREMAAIYEDCL